MVKQSQAASESSSAASRQLIQEFDKSVKIQRDYIYDERTAILNGSSKGFSIPSLIDEALDIFVNQNPQMTSHRLERYILDHITYSFTALPTDLDVTNEAAVKAYLKSLVKAELERKRSILGENMDYFEQTAVLKAIDEMWIEEVDYLQQWRILVSGRSTAQRNPSFEYHREALESYNRMKKDIRSLALHYLMQSEVSYHSSGKLEIQFI